MVTVKLDALLYSWSTHLTIVDLSWCHPLAYWLYVHNTLVSIGYTVLQLFLLCKRRSYDAFSTFYIGHDGLIRCHKVEKVCWHHLAIGAIESTRFYTKVSSCVLRGWLLDGLLFILETFILVLYSVFDFGAVVLLLQTPAKWALKQSTRSMLEWPSLLGPVVKRYECLIQLDHIWDKLP